jgi:sporulation protein YlmC with PRC-barrel domain
MLSRSSGGSGAHVLSLRVDPSGRENDEGKEMRTLEEVRTWLDKTVLDADGDKIGMIEDVFLDRHTGEPEWATVKTGLFGLKSSFVPIVDAELTGEDEVRVPFQKEQVKNAPKVDANGELSVEEERSLWEH